MRYFLSYCKLIPLKAFLTETLPVVLPVVLLVVLLSFLGFLAFSVFLVVSFWPVEVLLTKRFVLKALLDGLANKV